MHRASLKQRRVRRATRLADAATLAMCGLLRPLARHGRFAPGPPRRRRRLVLVQLDGVSRGRLERALADGLMPALAARLAAGSHVLSSCRSGAPPSTPALVATYLSDLVSVPEAGDLVVLGWRGPGRDVVAYAWEFGSHGGIAPEELESFVVHPAACRFPFERVVRPTVGAVPVLRARLPPARGADRSRARRDAAPTFPARFPLLRLDHAYVDHAVAVSSCAVIRSPLVRRASDHLPLVVELEIAAAARRPPAPRPIEAPGVSTRLAAAGRPPGTRTSPG